MDKRKDSKYLKAVSQLSISQSDALVFQDELDRVGLESFGWILPEDVEDAVIDLLHGRMLIRGLYFENLGYTLTISI